MSDSLYFNFEKPKEEELILKKHSYIFERLPNLRKALDSVFLMKKQSTRLDLLIFSLCKNSTNSFDEILLLCGNGFGNSALKLLAGMFENFIIARNLHLHPEETDEFWDVFLLKLQEVNSNEMTNKVDKKSKSLENFIFFNQNVKVKHSFSFWSYESLIKLASRIKISEELETAYHMSLKHVHPSINSFLSAFYIENPKKIKSEKNTSEIALTTTYFLLAEILSLMIKHFNLNETTPLYQQCFKDYKYVIRRDKSLFKKSSEPNRKETNRTENLDYKHKSDKLLKESDFRQEIEKSVGVTIDELTNLYLLESIKGFGPQKFKGLYELKIPFEMVIKYPKELSIYGKSGEFFQTSLTDFVNTKSDECRYHAIFQIIKAYQNNAKIITYNHPSYPINVYKSNTPIPILYARGSLEVLEKDKTVACVGSRKIRQPYDELHKDFVKEAVFNQFSVVSGFALGADRMGHEAAFYNNGSTICVMPCGLEKPFPPENKLLWNELINYPNATFVSEFPFGIRTTSLTLRKRNKLIVAFSLGVLIGQSSAKGGAMNAYRFAREQRKPVATFIGDKSEDTSGNHLISIEKKNGDAVFPNSTDNQIYQRWLRELYYLT